MGKLMKLMEPITNYRDPERSGRDGAFRGGKVYLVGAGPGDPDLITLKGLRCLRIADVVIYDRLVSPQLLEEIRPGALRIYVGKRADKHTLTFKPRPRGSTVRLRCLLMERSS